MEPDLTPRVYISYTWRTPGLKETAFNLAEQLRAARVDSRIDLYYSMSLHGFLAPDGRPGDARPPWMVWQEEQVQEADLILVLCTREYAESAADSAADSAAGWDMQFMFDDLKSGSAQRSKFIPAGFGPYGQNSRYIPALLAGKHYYNLGAGDGFGFEDLMRRIRTGFPLKRFGVFISYSHKDERWLEALKDHVPFLKQQSVKIWTDQEIQAGELWDTEIKRALASAKVAVLLVTPAFFNSDYIATNELPVLLEAAKSEGLIVVWIPVKDCNYQRTKIAQFQAAHPPSQPLVRLSPAKRDQAFVGIASKLAAAAGLKAP